MVDNIFLGRVVLIAALACASLGTMAITYSGYVVPAAFVLILHQTLNTLFLRLDTVAAAADVRPGQTVWLVR